jgi:hypothetical protein
MLATSQERQKRKPDRHQSSISHQTNTAFSSINSIMPRVGAGRDSLAFLFFIMKVAFTVVVFWNHFKVQALVPTANVAFRSQSTSQPIAYAGRGHGPLFASSSGRGMGGGSGMGMGGSGGSTTKSKKQGGKNKVKGSTPAATPFDVNASLLRMEKKYDDLTREVAKKLQDDDDDDDDGAENALENPSTSDAMLTSEYVVAARAASKRAVLPDWVPIAQLCLKRPESEYHEGAADAMVQMAVSACCRELSHVAAVGAPVFATIARNEIQYSVESIDSFHKFVYDDVMKGKSKQNPDETMTKAVARQTLGLTAEDGGTASAAEISKADIKQAYRKLSFELHPDRFEGTIEECEAAKARFGKVQLAYETLTSGVRAGEGGGLSWYESLGGRARTGFVGPVNLLPLAAAQEHLQRHNAEIAIAGLDPAMVQSFVARNLRSE